MIYYFRKDYKSAIECMRKNTEPSGHDMAWLAACYAATGEAELAAKAVAQACEIDKHASIAKYTQWDAYQDSARLESLRERMDLAGLPA
jgi:hypothetical protein